MADPVAPEAVHQPVEADPDVSFSFSFSFSSFVSVVTEGAH